MTRLWALWRLWQRRRALAWPVRECPASRLYATRLLLAKAERDVTRCHAQSRAVIAIDDSQRLRLR